MTSIRSPCNQQQINRQHKKTIKDLEKIYQHALNDKSFMAALKAKELQLKEMRGLQHNQNSVAPAKYTSIQDLIQYFSQYTTEELANLDQELLALIETSQIK